MFLQYFRELPQYLEQAGNLEKETDHLGALSENLDVVRALAWLAPYGAWALKQLHSDSRMWEADLDKTQGKPQHWEVQVSLDMG